MSSPMEKEVRRDLDTVGHFLLYPDRLKESLEAKRKDLAEQRDDVIEASPQRLLCDPVGGRRSARRMNNPTLQKVLKLLKLGDTRQLEEWLALVQEVEENLPPKMQIFLRLRREYRDRRGPYGWVAPVQHRYAQEVAALLGKRPEDTWIESRQTFSEWWQRILQYTALKAAKRGLIRADSEEN